MAEVYLYDTTLRDGAQTQGVDFSIDDKLKIAKSLDDLGVDYIEGGWPGANPTDTEFFQKKIQLNNSILTAFGMTKRTGRSAENDPGLSSILNSKTPAVCLVGKSWDFHVDVALGISNEENLENISESAKLFVKENKEFIKLELSSVLDLQDFKLPSRLCLASRCPWNYRGHGCAYEYNSSLWADSKMGDSAKQREEFGGQSHLPKYAPPVADDQNIQISGFGEVGENSWVGYDISNINTRISGEYDHNGIYPTGAIVYVEKHSVRYYYMSKGNKEVVDSDHPLGYGPITKSPPPNNVYWYSDRCSKSLEGCKLRHGPEGAAENDKSDGSRVKANLFLPFGGFPGTNSKTVVQ